MYTCIPSFTSVCLGVACPSAAHSLNALAPLHAAYRPTRHVPRDHAPTPHIISCSHSLFALARHQQDNQWIDRASRLIALQYNVYNPNLDLVAGYSYVRLRRWLRAIDKLDFMHPSHACVNIPLVSFPAQYIQTTAGGRWLPEVKVYVVFPQSYGKRPHQHTQYAVAQVGPADLCQSRACAGYTNRVRCVRSARIATKPRPLPLRGVFTVLTVLRVGP